MAAEAVMKFFGDMVKENAASTTVILGGSIILYSILRADLMGRDGDKAVFYVLLALGFGVIVTAIVKELGEDLKFPPHHQARTYVLLQYFVKAMRNCCIYSCIMIIISFEQKLYDSTSWGIAGAWLAVLAGVLIVTKGIVDFMRKKQPVNANSVIQQIEAQVTTAAVEDAIHEQMKEEIKAHIKAEVQRQVDQFFKDYREVMEKRHSSSAAIQPLPTFEEQRHAELQTVLSAGITEAKPAAASNGWVSSEPEATIGEHSA
jgi:hypothetical protein